MFAVVVAVVSDVVKGVVVVGDVDGEAADGFMKIDVRGSWKRKTMEGRPSNTLT